MIESGPEYLTSIWNYIDIITPTTILTILVINAVNIAIGDEAERIL
jgi:hypothetical protein